MLYRPEDFEPLTDEPWDADPGVALYLASCLDAHAGFPVLDA